MKYRKLGKYGVKVSSVSLGGWLTHGRSIDDATTDAIVKRAYELGVNFFDTADVYNQGEAEKALAKSIAGLKRETLVVATKCFFPMSDDVNDRGLSRKHIFESVHGSLQRLRSDYVDLMQFHRFDPDTPLEETVRAVDDLVRQGKILYWGVSLWPADAIEAVCRTAREWGCTLPVSNQPVYNLLNRSIEADVVPTSERLGLGQVVFSPLAQGVLTGKYRPGSPLPEGSRGADDKSNMFMTDSLQEANLVKVKALEPIAARYGLTQGQFALAWCLRLSNVSSVIVGASRVSQIEENVAASDAEVPDEAWAEAEKVFAA
ncbi:MAG: aldo/keto reductase family protein [Armatimonadetes bacterium]|nr:aldo/keto reductase family protein [Armatimonadota bacterium]